jgi:hypothetical protein
LIPGRAATAKAGNATGTLTQPVFNDQHGLIPNRLSDTSTLSQSLLLFDGNQTNCLSGAAPEFLCRVSPERSVGAIGHLQFTKSSFVADYNERK